MPCELKECESEIEELEVLLLENQYRDKTNYQKVKEGEVWDEIERAKAKAYQVSKLKQNNSVVPNLEQREKGKSDKIVAERVGLKKTSYQTGRQVAKTIDELKEQGRHDDADILIQVMDKSVSGALKAVEMGVLDRVDETKKGNLFFKMLPFKC